MSNQNNISAFPRPYGEYKEVGAGKYNQPESGMTLRDYFAGQALVGLVVKRELPLKEAAQEAYYYADEMMNEKFKEATHE